MITSKGELGYITVLKKLTLDLILYILIFIKYDTGN